MTGDDEKLAALFRDAAESAPPPGFGYGDVTAASRRIGARRRAVLVGGAVVLVAVAGFRLVDTAAHEQETATAAPAAAAPYAGDGAAEGGATGGSAGGGAASADQAHAPANGAAAPLGPASGDCANRQDPALRALVDQALPAVAGASAAITSDVCLPGGQRGVSIEVGDAGAQGLLSVSYLPPGAVPPPVAGALSAPTASGGTVIVSSHAVGPAGGPAPFASSLPSVVAFLAPRL